MSGKKKMLQIILGLIGLLGVIWFCLPIFTGRILNIGNGTGIVVFGVLFFCGIRMQRVSIWLGQTWGHRGGRLLLSLAGVLLAVIVILVVTFTALMIHAASIKPKGNPTVIVLGCRVYGERPSLMLTERMDTAYEYLTEHSDVVCILSGGQGSGEAISEAECMYRYLTAKGIAKERLYKEDRSTSTRENLEFSKEIIRENGFAEDLVIVTNEFHQYRARKIAQALQIEEISAVSGRTAWWLLPTYYVRELYGIIYQALL